MLRHSALDKVGLLDEDFFMYGEDVDLSYRLLKGGFENWYVPARILHYKGESAHKSSFRYVHVFYNAMLIFFRKHYGNMAAVLSLPIKAAIVVKATLSFIQMQMSAVRKNLGFRLHNSQMNSKYLFIGSKESIEAGRKLLMSHGVEAEYVVGDVHSMPDGHKGMLKDGMERTYVVYDTDAYSYDDIFRIFSANSMPNVFIGTYNPHTNIIITSQEVMK